MQKSKDDGEADPWTQYELNLLHEMVREYDRAKWFKGQLWWWGGWVLGLPALALTIWEPLVRLWKSLKGG
jgi:hypothetical protein